MNTVSLYQPKVTSRGWYGTIVSMMMILSINADWRIPIGGTLMHPYLVALPLFLIIGNFYIFRVGPRIVIPIILFALFFSFPMLLEGSYSEILKVVAGILTLLFFVDCVGSERDIEVCTLGFIIVGVWISLQIIFLSQTGDVSLLDGVNALEGLGNKNAQSQFTLPALFFCCFNFYSRFKSKKYLTAIVYIGLSIPIILGSVLSGNRSGYLGVVLIVLFLMIALRFNFTSFFSIVIIIGISYVLVEKYAFKTFERKYEQSTSGDFYSDQLRQTLITESLMLGIKHPFPGLGFKGLTSSLADVLNLPFTEEIDPHNLYGYLLGAGGIFSFVFFLWFVFRVIRDTLTYRKMWKRVVYYFEQRGTLIDLNDRRIHIWVISFMLLYLFRSFFTRELIYSPNFMGGLGLMLGALHFYKIRIRDAVKR